MTGTRTVENPALDDWTWTVQHDQFCHHTDNDTALPAIPHDMDGYCCWCGNGRWKHHAPWCRWADSVDLIVGWLAA